MRYIAAEPLNFGKTFEDRWMFYRRDKPVRAGERACFHLELAGEAEKREIVGLGAAGDEHDFARFASELVGEPLACVLELQRGLHSFRVYCAGIADDLGGTRHFARGRGIKRSRTRVVEIDAPRTEKIHMGSVRGKITNSKQ